MNSGEGPVDPGDHSFRLLVESVTDYAIFMLDPAGIVRSWNAGAARIKGWSAAEIVGQHFSRFYPPEDVRAGKCERELAVAARAGRFEEEGWRLRKDGSSFWANVVITPMSDDDGAPIGFAKVTRDLTERRAAEETLRRSEERFRLLVESVTDYAIFMLDPDGRVATWNRGAERIKGYRSSEIVGQHFSRFYPEDDVRAGKCEHELEVAARVGRFEDEGWRVRKDGSRMWANVVITALRDPAGGELLGFGKVTRDLTDRRRAEDARVELAKAHEAVRMRDEFISIASHELRTPLSTLRLQTDAMARALEKNDAPPERIAARLSAARSQIGRLEQLISALLDVSRIESGRLTLDRMAVDLSTVAREAAATLGESLARAGCQLDVDAPAPVLGNWDGGRLEQVVVNLLTNAAKYGRNAPIHVSVRCAGDRAELTVRDQGLGIAPEHQQRIFERFERAADARHFGGLGLGLWLSRQIVEAHGGTIRVSSALGAGASFVVELPTKVPE